MQLKWLNPILILAAVAIFGGYAYYREYGPVNGSGKVVIKSIEIEDFATITFWSIGTLVVQQGDRNTLTIEAEHNIQRLLVADSYRDKLYIDYEWQRDITPTKPIKFIVEAKDLEFLSLKEGGNAIVRNIQQEELRVFVRQVGHVEISGNIDKLNLSLGGEADFDGEDLQVRQAEIWHEGSGEVVINVADELEVNLSNSGNIKYLGSPKIEKNITGSGNIQPL
jgi:hypothetical protein